MANPSVKPTFVMATRIAGMGYDHGGEMRTAKRAGTVNIPQKF